MEDTTPFPTELPWPDDLDRRLRLYMLEELERQLKRNVIISDDLREVLQMVFGEMRAKLEAA